MLKIFTRFNCWDSRILITWGVSEYHRSGNLSASWYNLTDDVTTCSMMTSQCVIELIMLGLV